MATFSQRRQDDLPGSPYTDIVGNPPYVRHHWIRGISWRPPGLWRPIRQFRSPQPRAYGRISFFML